MSQAAVMLVQPTESSEPQDGGAARGGEDAAERMLNGIGQLTRKLHESLRELGYDKLIEEAASTIPDARDRLSYVATMTEQAAQRALNATDVAQPLQQTMSRSAQGLESRWNDVFARRLGVDAFGALVADTRSFLGEVQAHAGATNAQLMEIVMAQDFQDLTGQVIKKTTEIIRSVEQQLVELLLESVPPERRTESRPGLLNGPVIDPGRSDVVTSQSQVDDLLESLGF